MKNKKNLLSFLLAMVMLFTTFTPVFAAGEGRVESSSKLEKSDQNQKDEIQAEYEDIEGKAYATFSLDSLEDLGSKTILKIGTRSIGDPLDGDEYKYWRVGIQWSAHDSYFPKDTKIQLQFEDKTKPRRDPERYITVAESDVILQENHTTDYEYLYHLKQTVEDDVLNGYNQKTKDGSRKYRWKIRYPLAMTDSVSLQEDGRDGITLTITQVPMPLYSVNWNVLSDREGRPAFKAKWYDEGNTGTPINNLKEKINSNNEESITEKKYYSMWSQSTEFNYITDENGASYPVNIVEYGPNLKINSLISGPEGTKFQRLTFVDSDGNEQQEKEKELTANGKKYKYTITGDHRNPFGLTIAEGLEVTYNPNKGEFDDASKEAKKEDGWHSEKMPNMPTGLKLESTDPKYTNLTFAGWSTKQLDPADPEDMDAWENAKPLSDNLKTITEKATVKDLDNQNKPTTKQVDDIRQEWPDDLTTTAYKVDENTPLKGNITLYAVYTKQLAGQYQPLYKEIEAPLAEQTTSEEGEPQFYAEKDGKVDKNEVKTDEVKKSADSKLDPTKPYRLPGPGDSDFEEAMKVLTELGVDTNGVITFTSKSFEEIEKLGKKFENGELTVNVPVIVTYKDGSEDKVEAPIKLQTLAGKYQPNYEIQDQTATKEELSVTADVAFKELQEDGSETANPDMTGKLADADAYVLDGEVTNDDVIDSLVVNASTGQITFNVKKVTELQNKIPQGKPSVVIDVEIPVKVTYSDGSTATVKAVCAITINKSSDKDIIPYKPTSNDNPTAGGDKNIPTKDADEKNIDPTQYVRVAVKIDPDDAGVLAIKSKDNPETYVFGPVVSALVKKGKTWGDVKAAVDTNRANPGYAFWYWEGDNKVEPKAETNLVANGDTRTAYFIKDGQKIEEEDNDRALPEGWHKVTVTKDDATIEDNASYGKTYAVAPKSMLAKDKFPKMIVKTVVDKEFSEPAWYEVVSADVENEVKEPWTKEVKKDTTFKAKAEEMVTINYARNPEKAEDGTDIARLTRDDEKVKLSGEPKGSKVELKNNDYKFVNWTNEANQEVSKALEYKPSSNVKQTYTANFVKKADVMITYKVNDEEAGTVNDKLKDTESLAPSTGNAKGATAKAKPGYEFVNWTNEAGKQVSVAEKFVPEKKNGLNVEATYTANFKQLISAQPSIQPVTEGDKDITVIVEGNPKGTLEVTIPGVKNPIPATKQKDGSYKVTVPEEITLKSGDEIVATFTEENKKPSTDRVTVKGKTSTPITPPKSDKTVERVDGDDRVDTSIEVSKKYFRQAETVIVARKDLYPDALSAAVLSRLLKAPILLTATNELDERVAQEIKRLGASQVIIAGGYSAISKYTERELSQFDKDRVERLGGLDRYETSAIVAERVLGITGGSSHRAVVATGEDFPDALTSGAFAAKEAYPILLVRSSGVPETINKVIRDNKINEVYVIGGETRIPSKVVSQLPKMIARLAGSDRYETSVAVAKYAFGNSYKAYIASGEVFPDTLVIAPVAARDFAPILLTTKNELPESVKSYIDSSNFSHFVIVGGPARISKAIEESLAK